MVKLSNRSRILLLMLIVVLSMVFVYPATAQPTDIKGHWAEQQISSWFDKGLAKGNADGTFKPDSDITRAEFAAMVNRAFKFSENGEAIFLDVSPDKWYAEDVSIAGAAGYISGYGDGTFRPENKISRQEAAVMIARLLELNVSDLTQADVFSDADRMQQWSKGAVGAVYKEEIMHGYQDNSFRPGNPITRAEAVVTIDRAMGYAPDSIEPEPEQIESGIEGTVTFEGKEVKNAVVRIFAADEYEVLEEAKTDNDGNFKVELKAGSYDVTVTTDEEIAYSSDVKVSDSKFTESDFELEKAAVVKGILKDKNGKAVKNTTVLFTTNPTFVGETNSRGEFTLPVLPDREYTVRAYELDEDKAPRVVEKELKVGNAGTFEIEEDLEAPFSAGGSGGGGGGGGGGFSTPSTSATVGTPEQLTSALNNNNIKTIIFSGDITANIDATRLVNIDFAGYTLTGNVSFNTPAPGSITISGTDTPAINITGNLTVNTPNATVTNKAKVNGTVIIKAVSNNTWNEEANGNSLDVQVVNGSIIINGNADNIKVTNGGTGLTITVSGGGSVQIFTVDATANIVINGSVDNVVINAPVNVTGGDKIKSAEINSEDVVLDMAPQEYSSEKGLTIGGQPASPKAAKPSAEPPAGEVTAGTLVELETKTVGAAVYYTDNGDTPTTASTEYIAPIKVDSSVTLKAIAAKTGWDDSDVLTAAYTVKEPTEPQPLEATFTPVNSIGIHEGKVYEGYELSDSTDQQIALTADNIESITVLEPGATEAKTLTPDTDPLLWFNVEKTAGEYNYTVVTKAGKTYEAGITWTAPQTAEWEATGGEGEHEGTIYVEYQLVDGEDNPISLKEGNVRLIAQKEDQEWVKLDPNTDENLWFNKSHAAGSYEFLVANDTGLYKATLDWDPNAANVNDFASLKAALADTTKTVINITEDISGINERLTAGHAVIINGNNHTLSFTNDINSLTYGSRHGLLISADNTVVNDLKIVMSAADVDGWQGVYGLQVYDATCVTINNYTCSGGDAALLVNGSDVTLTGTTTVGENEFGGIEVSMGTDLSANSKLTVEGNLVNTTEAYRKPTVWVINGQGEVNGTNVPTATNTTIKSDQTQYYLNPDNAEDPSTSLTVSADNIIETQGEQFEWPVNVQGTVAPADAEDLVRFYAVIPGLTADDIVLAGEPESTPLVITDTTERGYAGAQEGDLVLSWGPAGGFPLGTYAGGEEGDYDHEDGLTTTFKATINTAGKFDVRFVFYNITDGKQINYPNDSATITVEEPDTTAPELGEVTLTNDAEGNLVLTVTATDDGELASLEVDHSLQGDLPEFTVLTENMTDESTGASSTFENGTWTMNFGPTMSPLVREKASGTITFYFVIKDAAGNQFGDMYDVTEEMTRTLEVPEAPTPGDEGQGDVDGENGGEDLE